MIDADGSVLGVYRKSHIPDGPGYQEKYYFSPGDTGFKVFDTAFGRLGVAICWDQWFPEAARAMALAGAEILCAWRARGPRRCMRAACTAFLANHLLQLPPPRPWCKLLLLLLLRVEASGRGGGSQPVPTAAAAALVPAGRCCLLAGVGVCARALCAVFPCSQSTLLPSGPSRWMRV
jgi:hypothetical protein